ncbi:retrovirus-related pol polyprotein from type-1 retrotransposable element r1 [Plakobranchus ocellatus]|uniref:Retrovirus-related pol polyprotein from type-1 retrotransposable element r1 n=1 Tax=Plakobranchus ocellatus TaxID=259542 RepID=A0AAV4CEB7_9GAST|nr:retrovirus-related pol polyprotein from type-1 retrotransposable element r1 [Plakobranchus ocellatus]
MILPFTLRVNTCSILSAPSSCVLITFKSGSPRTVSDSRSRRPPVSISTDKEFILSPFHLDGQPILVKGEAKFLGVIFYQKLSFENHVKYLKNKCLTALNLLRVVGHTDWGADRATLLKLYRTLVRSKLDYGSVIYGSAKKYVLRALDPIHHQGLRIAIGAFRTSPIKSLYADAGEPSLEHRRMKLAFNYVLKLKSLPRNPCHEVVFEAPLSDFSAVTKSEPNLVANTFEHFKNTKISLNIIDNLHVQCPPPWEEHNITVDISLTKQNKENTTLALTEIKKLTKYHKTFAIYSDSLSALQAIQSKNFKVIDIRRLYNLIRKFPPYNHISFVWIPAHVSIQGNENVDKLAKVALNRESCSGKLICWSDLKPKINAYIKSVWQRDWDAEGANKLHEVLPNLGEDLHRRGEGAGRKRETAMCRLRMGHTYLINYASTELPIRTNFETAQILDALQGLNDIDETYEERHVSRFDRVYIIVKGYLQATDKAMPPAPHNITVVKARGAASVESKRKAEDLPTLMSVSPFSGWSPFKKFMVISSRGSAEVADRSPFKIHRELKSILGDHRGHQTW